MKKETDSAIRAAMVLGLLAAVTRLPWLTPVAEADSARYLVGLRQWARFGPGARGIYGGIFSPGYYWLAARSGNWLRIRTGLGAGHELAIWSALAAIATAPLIYFLGRRLVRPWAAMMAAIAFLFTPGYWWLGLEAHPQGISIALMIASLLVFSHGWTQGRRPGRGRAPGWGRCLAAGWLLTAAVLIKSDAILLLPAYLFFAWWAAARAACADSPASAVGEASVVAPESPLKSPAANSPQPPPEPSLEPALESSLVPSPQSSPQPSPEKNNRGAAAARPGAFHPARFRVGQWLIPAAVTWLIGGVTAMGLRQWILGAAFAATQQRAAGTLGSFLAWPRGMDWARQSAPMLFAVGWAVWLWIAAGLALFFYAAGSSRRGGGALTRRAAGWLLVSWSLPLYGFWFAVRGNNTRHVALAVLPLLWLAAEGWVAAVARAAAGRARAQSAAPAERATQAARAGPREKTPAGDTEEVPETVPEGIKAEPERARGGAQWRWLWAPLAAALALDCLAPPPNSNVTLYPSEDVPASVLLLRRREDSMDRLALRLASVAEARSLRPSPDAPTAPPDSRPDPALRQALHGSLLEARAAAPAGVGGRTGARPRARAAPARKSPTVAPDCYFGVYTDPYLIHDLLRVFPAARLGFPRLPRAPWSATDLEWGEGARLRFIEIARPGEIAALRRSAACAQLVSLEFSPRGLHRRFLGSEWRFGPP